ncbi:mycothiol acetyltransferase [Nocardioides szechwanensis]|uniref:Mycothiol acetyltransferase n=1 Tax=Nocardioides szechwanensis TaxID=1005944 RepID=A0A1H0BT40_9ACTN|nr:mycothiol synthase [Nocardioides szechwanensis]GEP33625.1 mycothiol acetyltransferase [Nocardioides szechwanensis]SDN48735.1 mycothiol synthase [Nocardioides szechwanensis]
MRAVEEIAAEAEAVDGAAPVDEAIWRALRHHPEQVRSFHDDDGFALLVGPELSLVVRPEARGRGIGRALLGQALAEAPEGTLLAWSHADHPAAAALAATHGFESIRALWVMRRPTAMPLPELVVPRTVTLRSYRPDDASEVVRVNAAAFAAHPEQGRMDAEDLAARMAEKWFDPAGLIVADAGDGTLRGFHWTKRHSPQLAEVYVVAIDPAAQGQGLGKVLTLAGLRHLADADEVLLYVESDNAPAIAVYSGLGFTHAPTDTHVQYRC